MQRRRGIVRASTLAENASICQPAGRPDPVGNRNMKKQYKTFLVYPDGSVHPGEIFYSPEKMQNTVRAIARKPGVRYRCEEWTVNTTAGTDQEPRTEKVAEYEL